MSEYYLMQRLESRPEDPRKTGLNRFFNYEYMGASEYEWGAIPETLAEMRRAPVIVTEHELTIHDLTRTVYLISHADQADERWQQFLRWVEGSATRRSFLTLEITRFERVFRSEHMPYASTDAWLALREHVALTLDPMLAELLAAGINNP